KLKKALYGLKQAPRAWYDELSTFLLHNHFLKGTIDPTLFIRRFYDDILVVQVYVDDIIFGSTHPRYIQLFSDLMKSHFEMSMMGEMTFFLGLQVNQSTRGIFINQSNYVLEILKKYGMQSCDPVGTSMEIKDKLDLDQNGTPVDATKYHSMIDALLYLTSSRPNIVHATCLCARYQAQPTEKHLKEDADYTGCKDTFNSTSGGAQFLGEKLVRWSSKKQDCTALSTAEAEYVSLSACCAQGIVPTEMELELEQFQQGSSHEVSFFISFSSYFSCAKDGNEMITLTDLVLRRREEKSLNKYSFLGEYECSSLALDREERKDEKEEIGSLETRSNNVSNQEI
nr:uncharacterized mitochondrial protein AtMg00810-like [Tanacetum cinerariifolium]